MDHERHGYVPAQRHSPIVRPFAILPVPQGTNTMHSPITTLSIPTVGGGACQATVHRAAEGAPLVLHLHAGAFVRAPSDSLPWVVRLWLRPAQPWYRFNTRSHPVIRFRTLWKQRMQRSCGFISNDVACRARVRHCS